jgi:tetratricopeptide (TPR) repeat protein
MQALWNNGVLPRILLIVVITVLLGLSPLPHVVELGLVQVERARSFQAVETSAQNLALVAEHLPWRPGLWEQAGFLALKAANPENAIEYFKNAAAAGDLSEEGYLAFGDAYKATGNTHTGVQIWEASAYIHGPSEQTLVRLADVRRERGDYPALINILKEMLTLETNSLGSSFDSAELNYELGLVLSAEEPASAPPYLLQAVEINPAMTNASALAFTIQRALPQENPTYTLMAAGRKLAILNEWVLAAHAFQKVTEIQPEYGEAWAFLGEAWQHLDENTSENALSALETALEIDPQSLSANILMSLYWQRAGNPNLFYKYLTTAEDIDPNNPMILIDLGEAAAILGDLETGYSYILKAIDQTYNDPAYLRALVEFCIRYNYNLDEVALPTARRVIFSDPGNPASMDLMGQVLLRMGDLLNAERFLLRALDKNPGYAPAYLHLGLIYSMQDKPTQAAEAFNRAITLAPGTPTAYLAEGLFDISILP